MCTTNPVVVLMHVLQVCGVVGFGLFLSVLIDKLFRIQASGDLAGYSAPGSCEFDAVADSEGDEHSSGGTEGQPLHGAVVQVQMNRMKQAPARRSPSPTTTVSSQSDSDYASALSDGNEELEVEASENRPAISAARSDSTTVSTFAPYMPSPRKSSNSTVVEASEQRLRLSSSSLEEDDSERDFRRFGATSSSDDDGKVQTAVALSDTEGRATHSQNPEATQASAQIYMKKIAQVDIASP